MTKKTAIVIVLAVLAGALLLRLRRPAPGRLPGHRFNVLILVADAMRRDDLGCYGGPARTPNIDWLAQRGVLFENAYSNAPWTAPSAVALFTGELPSSFPWEPYERTLKIHVPEEELLPAEQIAQAGYEAWMRVENVQATLHNCFQGFRALSLPSRPERTVPARVLKTINEITGRGGHHSFERKSLFVVLRRILMTPPGKRFLVVHWILDPHEPYQPEPDLLRRIQVDESKLRRKKRFYTSRKNLEGPLNEEEERYIRNLYLAEIESVDRRIGFLLEALRRKGLMDSTYIVVTSDHGEAFGEHDAYGHGAFGEGAVLYETLIRVPLVIYGPDLPAGLRISDRVSHVDLMPTILELLGLPAQPGRWGRSYAALLKGGKAHRRPVYVVDINRKGTVDALIAGPYKLISLPEGARLYDLAEDPGETRDLSAERRKTAERLSARIEALRKACAALRAEREVLLSGKKERPSSAEERRKLREQLRSLGYIE